MRRLFRILLVILLWVLFVTPAVGLWTYYKGPEILFNVTSSICILGYLYSLGTAIYLLGYVVFHHIFQHENRYDAKSYTTIAIICFVLPVLPLLLAHFLGGESLGFLRFIQLTACFNGYLILLQLALLNRLFR